MSIAIDLQRIEDAGFTLEIDGADIIVNPPGRLTPEQRGYLVKHKAEIFSALKARELESSGAGSDLVPANDAELLSRLSVLPSDLVMLAIRYCTELYADSPEQVTEMLEDLVAVPDDWHWWRGYFMAKLGIPEQVLCIDCTHCQDTTGNLGRCLKGVPAPGAGGLWWMSDLHPCVEYEASGTSRNNEKQS